MSNNFSKFTVYAALFLVPLFTLPFTANVLDFPKQFLLLFLTIIGFVFWLWAAVSERKFHINLNPINLFPLGLIAAVFVSGVFSLYRYGSFWGWPLPVAESFAAVASFGLLYFLVVNNFRKSDLPDLIGVLGISAAIAAVYGVLQAFGIYLAPFLSYAKDNPAFNTVGSTGGFLVFLAIVLAMILPLAFAAKNKWAIPMKICAAILFATLVFFNGALTIYLPSKAGAAGYDFSLAPWIALGTGMLSLAIFAINNQKFSERNRGMKNTASILFFCAVLFSVFNIFARPIVLQISENLGKNIGGQIGSEIALRQTNSAAVAVETLKQSPREFFLGSGPGTFGYDYVKFRPKQIAQDNLGWNLTFFSGSSEFLNRVATTGVLGGLLFLLLILVWIIEGFRVLVREEEKIFLPLAVFSGWLAIAVAAFYYPFNLALMMLFWFALAAVVAVSQEKTVLFPLDTLKKNYAASMIFVVLLIGAIALMVQSAKNYYAEVAYLEAVEAFAKKDIATAVQKLNIAADATNRLQDNYLTGLAQAYWAQAEQEIEQKKDQEAQVALQAAAPYLQEAVKNAVQSTEIANPNNSFNWAFRAQIYRKLIGVDEGFDDWALNMYEKAIKLETSNPTLYNEVGQVYLIKNDLEKAKLAFEKAVELMPQYIDAHYYLALIADKKGDRAAAIGHLEIVGQLLPADDAASRENIEKAIDTLRRGGSISSPAAESTPAVPPASGDELSPASGSENAAEGAPASGLENAESAPEDVLPPEPAAVND